MALLVCAAAPAATISTTLTVNATAKPSADLAGFAISGTANFTGSIGNGNIAASISVTVALASDPVKTPFTINLASGGTLTGELSVPQATLLGTATNPSVTLSVKGGSGSYSDATGSLTLAGSVSGSIVTGFTFKDFTGTGTITTGAGDRTGPATPTIDTVQNNYGLISPGSELRNRAEYPVFY